LQKRYGFANISLYEGNIHVNLSHFKGNTKMIDEKALFRTLLGEFHDKLNRLDRDFVLRNAEFPKAPNKIKVAIGMRRSGKTYFLYQQIMKMLAEGIDRSSILYLNFEDDRLLPLDTQKLAALTDAFYTLYPENHDRKCYLFFDEIQNVVDWPIVIRRFQDSKNVEIFLTGSSAKLLSKEIATNLRGRSLAIEIWPYSFNEYLRAKKISIDTTLYDKKTKDKLSQVFDCYLSEGGFPEVISYEQDVRQRTLQDYIDVVIYRDIIERHHLKNPSIVKYMILSMLHNVGKPFSINKFYHDITGLGFQIGKDSLYEYPDYIEDAYLAFSIPEFEQSIRKQKRKPKKYYAIDPGMVRASTLDYEKDLGRLFENVIYLELRRLGCHINYYLTQEGYEVDFLAQTSAGKKKLFQVSWGIQNTNTKQRELRALDAAMKELKVEGELITLDSYLQDGINFNA
jgi:uncharacterized protein